jgi:hypothetical protein
MRMRVATVRLKVVAAHVGCDDPEAGGREPLDLRSPRVPNSGNP